MCTSGTVKPSKSEDRDKPRREYARPRLGSHCILTSSTTSSHDQRSQWAKREASDTVLFTSLPISQSAKTINHQPSTIKPHHHPLHPTPIQSICTQAQPQLYHVKTNIHHLQHLHCICCHKRHGGNYSCRIPRYVQDVHPSRQAIPFHCLCSPRPLDAQLTAVILNWIFCQLRTCHVSKPNSSFFLSFYHSFFLSIFPSFVLSFSLPFFLSFAPHLSHAHDIPGPTDLRAFRPSSDSYSTLKEESTLQYEQPTRAFFIIVLLLLCAYRAVLQILQKLAWHHAVRRMQDNADLKHPKPFGVVPGWGFHTKSPSYWGVEIMFHSLVHVPVYSFRFFLLFVYYIPRDAIRRYVLRRDVTDQILWDFLTNTTLILMCETDESGDTITYRCRGCNPRLFIKGDPSTDCPIDGSTLTMVMRNGVLLSAYTAGNVPVTARKGWLTRNEILADALARTHGMWAHALVHHAGERCAAEVARMELTMLKPCALHTHSLHDGLIHSPIGPTTKHRTPLTSYPDRIDALVASVDTMLPHEWYNIKTPGKFRYLKYFLQAHGVVRKLFRKYGLSNKLSVDDFFSLVVLHDADHLLGYQVFWDRVPLRGSNDSSWAAFYASMYQNALHQQFWTPPIVNPLCDSMYLRDSKEPFFRELYRELARIDVEIANMARYSITF